MPHGSAAWAEPLQRCGQTVQRDGVTLLDAWNRWTGDVTALEANQEIRTPLNAVIGLGQVLMKQAPPQIEAACVQRRHQAVGPPGRGSVFSVKAPLRTA
ncbi:hypothetical protein [Azohydromonas australica]|uniref:hypothetical protein n=1 Tax=Azohydromonas australica TaxID=364039 RepID=UPI000415D733|nr:hypothetical protein [Azohydromonas australica]